MYDDGFAVKNSSRVIFVPYDNYTGVMANYEFIAPKAGIYFTTVNGIYTRSMTIPGYKAIKEECIPVVDDIIIRSSTADSEKKFKITVDDTGAISATEV